MRYYNFRPYAAPVAYAANTVMGSNRSYGVRKSRTDRYVKRRSMNNKPASLKQVMRSMESAHHLAIGDNTNSVNLTHNTFTTCNVLNSLAQGALTFQRTGDTVFLETLKVRMFWDGPTVSSNGLQLRIFVLYHDDFYANSSFASGLVLGDLAVGTTGTARAATTIIDPKKATVIYDEVVLLDQSIANVADTALINFNVKVNKAFNFVPATQEGKDRNLYIVLVPSIAGGVTGTTACGAIYCNFDMIFKVSK